MQPPPGCKWGCWPPACSWHLFRHPWKARQILQCNGMNKVPDMRLRNQLMVYRRVKTMMNHNQNQPGQTLETIHILVSSVREAVQNFLKGRAKVETISVLQSCQFCSQICTGPVYHWSQKTRVAQQISDTWATIEYDTVKWTKNWLMITREVEVTGSRKCGLCDLKTTAPRAVD